MLTINVELNETDRQRIRELAAYFEEEPNEFVNGTADDILDTALMILEEEEEKKQGQSDPD